MWCIHIKDEYQQEFIDSRLETYNFLRHADRRPDDKLGVHAIALMNEIDLIMNVNHYWDVSKDETEHTRQFMHFISLTKPEYYTSHAPVGAVEEARRELRKLERHTIFEGYRKVLAANAAFQREREQDLCDLGRVQPLKA